MITKVLVDPIMGGTGMRSNFVTFVTIPADSISSPRVNAILRMPGKGTAWFDMIQVVETVEIRKSIDPAIKNFWFNRFN